MKINFLVKSVDRSKTKISYMPHKKKTRISAAQLHVIKTALPLLAVASVLGATYYTQQIVPHQHPASARIKVVQLKTQPATPKPKPKPTPTPTPTPSPTPIVATPQPTPVASKPVVSSKPQPVVVPAPTSSVNSLTPAAPAPTPTPAPGNPTPTPTPTPSGSQTTGYTSTNWSGYLAANARFTTVSGAWRVPLPTGNGVSTSADSSWIGIGGVTAGDLIQIGTDNTVLSNGTVRAEAFYEMLPAVSQTVPGLTVSPGDSMTASISETSTNLWSITITDTTTSQTFSTTVSYTSSHSSAEWIEEDPSYSNGNLVPFDNFGTVMFTNGATTTSSSLSIAGAGGLPITMVNGSHQPIATPSALSGGSFSVTHN